jgi:glycosyltransferase involved in cell wall biosynthesis
MNKFKGIPRIWFYAWEGAHLPEEMVTVFPEVEHLITFSRDQVQVYKNDIKKDNITYLPHIVLNRNKFIKGDIKPYKKNDTFTFLSVFEWNARKDPITLVKAYLNAFSDKDDVSLILKVTSAGGTFLKTELEKINSGMRMKTVPPKIIPVSSYLSDEELSKLYETSHWYVSSPRGEGFGIPFLEALFHGTPVIAPDKFTDQIAFNDENSRRVATYDTFMFGSRYDINRGNNIWGQVSDVELAHQMRKVYDERDTYEDTFNPAYPSDEFIEAYNSIPDTLDNLIQSLLKHNIKVDNSTGD